MARTAVALAVAVALAAPARAAAERGGDVAELRFGWPATARARVVHRRTQRRSGEPARVFTARYELLAEPAGGGLRLVTRGTSWRGDLPVPPALSRRAIRASEAVAQRIGPGGEFLGLEGVEALRPVLAQVLAQAVPPDQAERALALALASVRADAEELWNLAVGFWSGADLRVGEIYAMRSEAEIPLLPGVRAGHAVEFRVRRRLPCASGERPIRCVEAVLRSAPDPAALERAADALLARLLPHGAAPPAGGLAAESELVLVTDPATLLPRKLVWTRSVRAGAPGGPPAAELVDRAEYEYGWLPSTRPPRRSSPRSAAAGGPHGEGAPRASPVRPRPLARARGRARPSPSGRGARGGDVMLATLP